MATLTFLSATVLDGLTMRYLIRPMLRFLERMQKGPVPYPAPMEFMLQHGWARRTYNSLFAVLLVGVWLYLGTPAGAARWPR